MATNIAVVSMGGDELCNIVAEPGLTGRRLKERISEQEGTSVMQQRLLSASGVLCDEAVVPGCGPEDVQLAVVVTLTRSPPAKEVHINGGQGGYMSLDAEGVVRPGRPFVWRMATVSNGEYTFQAGEGEHEGKFLSALPGDACSSGSNLIASGLADTWKVDTRDGSTFYNWSRAGPFACGIRLADRHVEHNGTGGWDAYWRWQPNSYHLAPKRRGAFQGDEAFWIGLVSGGAAVEPTH